MLLLEQPQVTPQEVVDARPKYDPEILDSLLRLARDNVVLRPIYPDLYQGYQNRDTWFTSDSGSIKTTVTAVHRFPAQDAVVVQGTVENETDQPLKFDGRAVTVQAGNRVYPINSLIASTQSRRINARLSIALSKARTTGRAPT